VNPISNLKDWFQHHDIAVKLKQALENVIVGQGLHIVFDGLQDGVSTVEVTFNGEVCTFYNKNPPVQQIFDSETAVEDAKDPADLPEDPPVVVKSKRVRKRKVETV
jgi:hypothetical protein